MDWNRRYVEGDTPWDKCAAHPAIETALAQAAFSGRILVPGCGTGHDVRALAARGLEVTGLDIAPLALEKARTYAAVGGEKYFLGDLFDLPEGFANAFDGVFEHTCFCAIDPERRADYVDAVAVALKPGGRLLSVFFLNPDNDGEGPPFGCTAKEIDGLFASRFRLLEEDSELPTFPEREGRELLRLFQRV
jgi:SAM-dependent methyltransferase